METNKNTKIFYLHIPKTGGQTLATRMASAFPHGRSNIIGDRLEAPNGLHVLNTLFHEFDFVEKHVRGPVFIGDINFSIVSTFREPIQQIVSNYLHVKREPRNQLFRPATELPPSRFFEEFGDLLGNFQTRRLVEVFHSNLFSLSNARLTIDLMFKSLDFIKWIVPTEKVDDFVDIWAIENKKNVPAKSALVNIAIRDSTYDELTSIVSEMPKLFALDLVLWQEANVRYSEYRSNVIDSAAGGCENDNLSLAYSTDDDYLWLRRGWYSPLVGAGVGLAWWSGPECFSEVRFKRSFKSRFVQFSIVVFCGVDFSELAILGGDRLSKLPVYWKKQSDAKWDLWVDVSGQSERGVFYIWVPEVWSPVMVSSDSKDFTRQGIATSAWELVENIPSDVNLK